MMEILFLLIILIVLGFTGFIAVKLFQNIVKIGLILSITGFLFLVLWIIVLEV